MCNGINMFVYSLLGFILYNQYIKIYWFHTLSTFLQSHTFLSFQMATIRVERSLVPITLPFQDDDHVFLSKDLLSLRFNIQVGTMYVEQEMYNVEGHVTSEVGA